MVTNASSSQRQKGIHVKVERNETVTIFGLNHKKSSTDAYLALPCSHLPVMQYEYYAAVHDTGYLEPYILFVGCEDSTTVTTLQNKKGCFDSIWLPQFHTSSASLNTVESQCLLYIPNTD